MCVPVGGNVTGTRSERSVSFCKSEGHRIREPIRLRSDGHDAMRMHWLKIAEKVSLKRFSASVRKGDTS